MNIQAYLFDGRLRTIDISDSKKLPNLSQVLKGCHMTPPSFSDVHGRRNGSLYGTSNSDKIFVTPPPDISEVFRRSKSVYNTVVCDVNSETSPPGISSLIANRNASTPPSFSDVHGRLSDKNSEAPPPYISEVSKRIKSVYNIAVCDVNSGTSPPGLSSLIANRNASTPPNNNLQLATSFKSLGQGGWQKGHILGSGSFGTVYEGFSENGLFFAVKEVSLHDQCNLGKERIFQLQQEISLLSRLRHKNVVQYLGSQMDDCKLYIFLELVTKGSLADLYQKYVLSDSSVSTFTKEILCGLKYLHEQKVVHRDIKCANLLVNASGSVKLADFGTAMKTTLKGIKSCKGSIYWMAPEVVNYKTNEGYSLKADIWSLGCTVLEMLTRKIPYYHLERKEAKNMISRGELPIIPDTLSTKAQEFIRECLRFNPAQRPTAAQLLDRPTLF